MNSTSNSITFSETMAVSVVTYFVLLVVLGLAGAVPLRKPRSTTSDLVRFSERVKFGPNRDTRAPSRILRCHKILDTETPLAIEVETGKWSMTTMSTNCSTNEAYRHISTLQIEPGTPIILNDRTPLCSFQLQGQGQISADNPLQATFLWKNSTTRGIYTVPVSDINTCAPLCGNRTHPWLPYAHKVLLLKNGVSSADYIKIFSDSACQNVVNGTIGHDANLVAFTRTDRENVVRSISFSTPEP